MYKERFYLQYLWNFPKAPSPIPLSITHPDVSAHLDYCKNLLGWLCIQPACCLPEPQSTLQTRVLFLSTNLRISFFSWEPTVASHQLHNKVPVLTHSRRTLWLAFGNFPGSSPMVSNLWAFWRHCVFFPWEHCLPRGTLLVLQDSAQGSCLLRRLSCCPHLPRELGNPHFPAIIQSSVPTLTTLSCMVCLCICLLY